MRIFGIGKLCGSEKHEIDRDKVVHCRGRAPGPEIGAAESRIFCAGCGLSRWPAPAEWSTRLRIWGSGVRISSGAPIKSKIYDGCAC